MRAKISVVAVSVDCPKCGDSIAEPSSGSLGWDVSQVHGWVTCLCGAKVALVLPKSPVTAWPPSIRNV